MRTGLCHSLLMAGFVLGAAVMVVLADSSTMAPANATSMVSEGTTANSTGAGSGATSVTVGLVSLLLPALAARFL